MDSVVMHYWNCFDALANSRQELGAYDEHIFRIILIRELHKIRENFMVQCVFHAITYILNICFTCIESNIYIFFKQYLTNFYQMRTYMSVNRWTMVFDTITGWLTLAWIPQVLWEKGLPMEIDVAKQLVILIFFRVNLYHWFGYKFFNRCSHC